MKKFKLGRGYVGDAAMLLYKLPPNSIDLTITSPPYDKQRTYKGYTFDFETIAKGLYRATKPGGVVVWVVGDASYNGSETGTSFRQALYFKDECGFRLHDTMIFHKSPPPQNQMRYEQYFEYMFVLSKGKPKTFNPITEVKKYDMRKKGENWKHRTREGKRGRYSPRFSDNPFKVKGNVWYFKISGGLITKDKIAHEHPAIFPEQLAHDHIISWSNVGDVVLDPMCGSGTVCKQAELLKRKWLGFDIAKEYIEITRHRILAVRKEERRNMFS